MTDSLTIFGTDFTGVTGIKATGTGNGTLTYIRPQGTKSISANGTGIDVAAYASVDVSVGSDDFIVTLSYNDQTEIWGPDCTYAEVVSAYNGNKDVTTSASYPAVSSSINYDEFSGNITYAVFETYTNISDWSYGYKETSYIWTSSGITVDMQETSYVPSDATAVSLDVAQGKVFYNASGRQVGSATAPTPTLQAKTYTVDSAGTETVTADSGYDGLSSVAVSVPSADVISWFDYGYTTVGGSRKWLVETGYVRNDGDDGNGWLSSDDVNDHTFNAVPANTTVTPSTSAQTIGGANYMMEGAVTVAAMPTGTAGTPTATKGSVSNHTISVTPSVTNTTGYITGGTKTGTAVTVSASELVSGSETKTANGTYDVTNLAELVVNVSSVKTKTGTFTGNGTRTIDVSCSWEPDLVYFTSDPGTTASSGTVAAIIVRGMMAATRYRNNSTTNSHYAIPGIANMNSSGSSYSWRATYANSKVTLYCYSSNARGLLTNGRTYNYTFMKWT